LNPGDFFGHEPLLYDALQTYSVKTATCCGLYMLCKSDIRRIYDGSPYFALELEEALEKAIQLQTKRFKRVGVATQQILVLFSELHQAVLFQSKLHPFSLEPSYS